MSSLTLEAGHVGSKTQEEKGDMKNGGLPLSEKGGFLTSQNGEIVHTVRSIDGGKRKNVSWMQMAVLSIIMQNIREGC